MSWVPFQLTNGLHPVDVTIPLFPLGEGPCASNILVFCPNAMELLPFPSPPVLLITGVFRLNFEGNWNETSNKEILWFSSTSSYHGSSKSRGKENPAILISIHLI